MDPISLKVISHAPISWRENLFSKRNQLMLWQCAKWMENSHSKINFGDKKPWFTFYRVLIWRDSSAVCKVTWNFCKNPHIIELNLKYPIQIIDFWWPRKKKKVSSMLLNFSYSEKAVKIWPIFHVFWHYSLASNYKWKNFCGLEFELKKRW